VTPPESSPPEGGPAEIAPGVFVATSPVYLTTTTIIAGRGGGCLLIDPALTVADLARLGEWLAARDLRAAVGWSTHAHWDHVLWSAALGADVPRFATARTVRECDRSRAEMLRELSAAAPGHDLDLVGQLTALPVMAAPPLAAPPLAALPWDGPPALVVSHDAHASGHGAIYLPDIGVLVAGDMLSDVEIPLLDLTTAADEQADPFGDYRAGLGLLAALPGVRHVVPGHGHVGDARELRSRIAADFRYLDHVEQGADLSDERLLAPDAGWLRADHARQRELAGIPLRYPARTCRGLP
jgi:glyoxylase-like metal-dependent hydrolase (beta-lactamase superfamily II)